MAKNHPVSDWLPSRVLALFSVLLLGLTWSQRDLQVVKKLRPPMVAGAVLTAVAQVRPVAAPAVAPELQIRGTLITNKGRFALTSAGTVAEGQSVEGHRIARVTLDSVDVESKGHTSTFHPHGGIWSRQ